MVRDVARQLPLQTRSEYLEALAARLRNDAEVGDGVLHHKTKLAEAVLLTMQNIPDRMHEHRELIEKAIAAGRNSDRAPPVEPLSRIATGGNVAERLHPLVLQQLL